MVVAGSAWIAWSRPSVPSPTRNSAWVVVPRWVRPAPARRALDGGDVDVGGQVLAPDVDVRVVVDAVAQVGPERAVATPDRVVELGRGMAVVDQEKDAAIEAGRRSRDPAVEREADLGALAVDERRRRSASRRAARAGVVGSVSTSTNAPSSQPTATSRRAPAALRRRGGSAGRRGPRWRGRGRRSARSDARRSSSEGARVSGGREPRRDRLETASARPRSGRSAGRGRGPDARAPGRRGSRAPSVPVPAPYSRSTNGSGPAEPVPRVGDRPGESGPEDRVRLRVRSGSRLRGRDGPPPPR